VAAGLSAGAAAALVVTMGVHGTPGSTTAPEDQPAAVEVRGTDPFAPSAKRTSAPPVVPTDAPPVTTSQAS
jgi:hypothetical protein